MIILKFTAILLMNPNPKALLKKTLSGISICLPLLTPSAIFALESCGENSPKPGVEVKVDESGESFKYRSTVVIEVSADNPTNLLGAQKIAKRKARAGFVEFWNDADLREQCATGDVYEQTINVVTEGDDKTKLTNTNQAYKVTCEIQENYKGILKAAKFGGDCHVGNLYFYSLIISEETVNAALGGQSLIKNSSSQNNDKKVKFNTYDKYEF